MGKLTHDDWCKLSQAFWRQGGLGVDQTTRINDFLKEQIHRSKPKAPVVHLKHGTGSPACWKRGNSSFGNLTYDLRAVTCGSCKRTARYRAGLAALKETEE